ncbi:hypothetical protein HHI36_014238 [Cryptolaemus montrouzieri]|uniref:Uncharacterized protein n=1 Tax=Cryptolaemus montrouzieri TaxID=559131 RepID=A0ABD2N1X5_9CUCU
MMHTEVLKAVKMQRIRKQLKQDEEMANFFGLKRITHQPTRVTNTDKSKIDLAFTNNKNIESQVTDSPNLSDHSWQKMSLPYQFAEKKVYKYIRKINYTELNCELEKNCWDTSEGDVDEMYELMIRCVERALNNVAPKKRS